MICPASVKRFGGCFRSSRPSEAWAQPEDGDGVESSAEQLAERPARNGPLAAERDVHVD